MKRKQPIGLLHPVTREFIIRWKARKKYPYSSFIDIADCFEIILESNAHFKDTSFTGPLTFDHIIDLREIKLGFDGPQLIDILVFYVDFYVRDRLVKLSKIS